MVISYFAVSWDYLNFFESSRWTGFDWSRQSCDRKRVYTHIRCSD